MSVDGLTIAVGAAHHNASAGMVRVLEWNGHRWGQVGEDIIGKEAGDNFGLSVSLSEYATTLAIGAPQLTRKNYPLRHVRVAENATLGGYVQVYGRDGDRWTQIGDDILGQSQIEICG